MKKPIIIIGLGEMGGVFAKGFLRSGYPVYPVNRDSNLAQYANEYPDPELVLLAVAEKDFEQSMQNIPQAWPSKLTLLQNELLPAVWISMGIDNPTVISVWFEKKKGQDVKVLLPSPVFGPHAGLIAKALASQEIPATELASLEELTHALVMKNLFVFTINIAGLQVNGTTGQLLETNKLLAEEVFNDVFAIQEKLTGNKLNKSQLFYDFCDALLADPEHKCQGRSAAGRLDRALQTAKELGIQTPVLKKIHENVYL